MRWRARTQFFINQRDNSRRGSDHRGTALADYGYAVLCRVTDGLDVVDAIAGVATRVRARHRNVPVTPIVINSITVQ